ncbi:hypothetical protein HDR58_10395 [bacterium]|nr:hypothetical protein [bacterium]
MKDLLDQTSIEYLQLRNMVEFLQIALEKDKTISKKDVGLFLDRMCTLLADK